MPGHKHHHKADHKHRHHGSDSDSDEKHHHKADHKHHKKHHKKHHHKHHHKKHHRRGSGSSHSSSGSSRRRDEEEDEEYVMPPAPAEPKEDADEVEEPEVEAQAEEVAEEEAEAAAEEEEKPTKKPSKKPSKKKPTKLQPNFQAQAPGTLDELDGQDAEEDGGKSGMSKLGKIALGGAAVALGAGAVGAGVMYHKKKKNEKEEGAKAAAAMEAAASVQDEPEDDPIFDVPAEHETKPGSINLYPEAIYGGEPPAADGDTDAACEEIKAACKGWGTDEDRLIAAMGSKSPTERAQIYHRYKELYKKDLQTVMRKEEKGDFGFALQCMSLPADMLDVFLIRQATKMGGTREDHLFPVICGRSNADIDIVKKLYFTTHDKDLSALIQSELTGDFERLAVACLQGIEEEYDPDVHTEEKAAEDATKFYDAGQGKVFGSDESGLFRILCYSPPAHLKAVNLSYADKYGYTLFKAFDKELHGITKRAAKFTLGMKLKPYETVAKLIKDSCRGIGTDETQLTSCLIRYHQIMGEVDAAYQELYGTSIRDAVAKEEGGDLGKLYMQMLQ